MRLLNFYTPGYRNLSNLAVVFTLEPEQQQDEGCSIRFLVGPNGSGKTNLLRFLTAIFAALAEGYPPFQRPGNPAYTTPFHLVYQVRGNTITIISQGRGRNGLTFIVQSEYDTDRYEEGEIPGRDLILPESLLIYTSGTTRPWQELLHAAPEPEPTPLTFIEIQPNEEEAPGAVASVPDTEEERIREEAEGGGIVRERIILVESKHLPLALLAAFIRHEIQMEQVQREGVVEPTASLPPIDFSDVLEQANVDRLLSFSLCLAFDSRELSEHHEELLAQSKRQATLVLDQWGDQWDKELWVFDLDDVREGERLPTRLLAELAGEAKEAGERISPFLFFRKLVDLQRTGILREVHLVVNQKDPRGDSHSGRTLLVENLSDGECAFLQRMALIHLLNEGERLFVFDEPEVHFNDTWKRDLVDHIERTLCNTNSEVILTTHTSVTLTDAYPQEVIRLGFQGQQNVPLTLAADPGEILRTVYDAPFSVGERARRKIEEAIKEAEETGDDSKLRELLRQVGPGYHRFKVVEVIGSRVSPDQEA